MQQSEQARASVFGVPQDLRVTPTTAIEALALVLRRVGDVWARGPAFDLAIINNLAAATPSYAGSDRQLIHWSRWRDERVMRDLVESCGYGIMRVGTAHDALDDAMHQTRNVTKAYEIMQQRKKN
jgi:hypothetical protein